MKPVYKCDYCNEMGTEEEIREHEPNCHYNYDRKSCYTCVHKNFTCKQNGTLTNSKTWVYECKANKEIPEGCIVEFCAQYERNKESNATLSDLFGSMFGSI